MGRMVLLMCGAAVAAGLAAALASWLRPELDSFSRASVSRAIPSRTTPPSPRLSGLQATHSGRTPAYVIGTDNLSHDRDDLARLGSTPITALPATPNPAATPPDSEADSASSDKAAVE